MIHAEMRSNFYLKFLIGGFNQTLSIYGVKKFGPMFIYFFIFCHNVNNLVLTFSIFSVYLIWSTVPARFKHTGI